SVWARPSSPHPPPPLCSTSGCTRATTPPARTVRSSRRSPPSRRADRRRLSPPTVGSSDRPRVCPTTAGLLCQTGRGFVLQTTGLSHRPAETTRSRWEEPAVASRSDPRPQSTRPAALAEGASVRQGTLDRGPVGRHRLLVLHDEPGHVRVGHLDGRLTKSQLREDVVEALQCRAHVVLGAHALHCEGGGGDGVFGPSHQILPLNACRAESSRVPPLPSP